MAGTWPTARAALKAQVHGVQWTATGHEQETLPCFEYPVARQKSYPYAYIIPPGRTVRRGVGRWRTVTLSPRVRVLLGGLGATSDIEAIAQRMEAAIVALTDALDDAVQLDGNADHFQAQSFSALASFEEDQAWGFEMTLDDLRVSETKTFTP